MEIAGDRLLPLPEKVLRYLRSHHVLTLATTCDGLPQAAALFYVADTRGEIYFLSAPQSRHSQNLQRDDRVAVTIHGEPAHWRDIRGLQIEGKAQPVTNRREREEALQRYLVRFPELLDEPQPDDAVGRTMQAALRQATLYRVEPTWIRWIDNAQGFGQKEEWETGGQ